MSRHVMKIGTIFVGCTILGKVDREENISRSKLSTLIVLRLELIGSVYLQYMHNKIQAGEFSL
jgi:hypothetical protein